MRRSQGFSLIEILISVALVAVAAMAAVAHVTRASGHADWAKDKVYAQQKALSILAELRGFVEGGEGEVAADLDGFDDGLGYNPTLSITPDLKDVGSLIKPDHPLSDNHLEGGRWRWHRQIQVRHYPGSESRDLRIATVRVFRTRATDMMPGERMAEVSSVIRTVAEASPSTQVYDVYLLALENVPSWWVHMDALQPFVESALQDIETRNPGLEFRTHWITTLGYGRDDEYAPYTNETRESTANTPWAYVYPGKMPAGSATERYYVPTRMKGRVNLDGETTPAFLRDQAPQESFTDENANFVRDPGEPFTDDNENGVWDEGNPVPYALADQHNHCKRIPESLDLMMQRILNGQQTDDTFSWRVMLDHMSIEPEKYKNAIIINLHGELLPMPPTRNYSDAAKDPEVRPGWRVVTHPERLRAKRVEGDDAGSDAPRYRVYAYKTSFPATGDEALMTQEEPYLDANSNGQFDVGETYQDWNGNSAWDDGIPMTLAFHGGLFGQAPRVGTSDFTARPNDGADPTLIVERLQGGIDADASGAADPYVDFNNAPRFPEAFSDTNGDGRRQIAETFLDLNGNGSRDVGEPFQDLDGDGTFTAASEALTDTNGNGRFDAARPAEPFTDGNGDGVWNAAEPYWDRNGNGLRDGPAHPVPPAWQPWNPADFGNTGLEDSYIYNYGEPFEDQDGDGTFDGAEVFFDSNGNGVRDGGFERGEMWFETSFDAVNNRTIVKLHGTPLETPYVSNKGLNPTRRLYDLDYIPGPMPLTTAAGGDRFARNLAYTSSRPKNTARWRVTLPLPAVRTAWAGTPGAGNGDAQDLLVTCETRLGEDMATGVKWPTWDKPQNVSRTYSWFYDAVSGIPFSELCQMRGDPRHMPYEDLDRHGDTMPNGYNWHFDNLRNGAGDYSDYWRALEPTRLRDGWRNATDHDAPRMLQWLRKSLIGSEAMFTMLSGFSFYYMSVGGDIGYDADMGYPSGVPMDGLPFGEMGDVFENTLNWTPGSNNQRGTRKFVRSNAGLSSGIRSGGYWWSKPWMGELFSDGDYAAQWKPWGNLRGTASGSPTGYRQIRRNSITSQQRPQGTSLGSRRAYLGAEGVTSFFNIGTSTSTFHHQTYAGTLGSLVGEGFELAANYGYSIPNSIEISRPFHLESSATGSVGSEWAYTDAFPRHDAQLVTRYFDHSSGSTGSGLVRLQEPVANPRAAYLVLNGLDRAAASGTTFVARYALISVIHSLFAAGRPGQDNRIQQLPRVEIKAPTLVDEIDDPETISVEWKTEWKRWDGAKYTDAYPDDFAEDDRDVAYRLLYSKDNGTTWQNMRTDETTRPGKLDWIDGVGPDASKTLSDWNAGGDETYTWNTPADTFPKGTYLIRVEAFRRDNGRHYARHEEKIYVSR